MPRGSRRSRSKPRAFTLMRTILLVDLCLFAYPRAERLRKLTLHASLETDQGEGPEIHISSDKKIVTVTHNGESSSIFLPTQIHGTADVKFEINKKTELSTRIQIDDVEEWMQPDDAGIEAPWPASDLSGETSIQCKRCQIDILTTGTVAVWKDLPSQDWADVMDLWYCHKPHEDVDSEEQKHAAETKGFSARSKLTSVRGTGLVDLASFLLHSDDCQSVKILSRHNENDLKLTTATCSNCGTIIGTFDHHDNLVRLSKSGLGVRTSSGEGSRSDAFVSFPTSTFISAQLLSLIESTSVRKVVVHSTSPKPGQPKSAPRLEFDEIMRLSSKLKQDPAVGASKSAASEVRPQPDTRNVVSHDATATAAAIATATDAEQKMTATQNETEDETSSLGLLLWIFNPSIYYSSSLHPSSLQSDTAQSATTTATSPPSYSPSPSPSSPSAALAGPQIRSHSILPHRAMKIFYQVLPDPKSYIDSLPSTTTEELHLSSQNEVTALHQSLEQSTSILPVSVREFQGWQVGLLDRWERHDTASRVMAGNPLARKSKDAADGGSSDGSTTKTTWNLPAGYQELYM